MQPEVGHTPYDQTIANAIARFHDAGSDPVQQNRDPRRSQRE